MHTLTQNKGELSDEQKEESNKFQKTYNKLLTNAGGKKIITYTSVT